MRRATRLRFPHLDVLLACQLALVAVQGTSGEEPTAEPPGAASEERIGRGRELFAREWLPGDSRSHGGDGLGPVYNERSCLGCHHLGGPGGGAGGDRNIEIVTANGEAGSTGGAFYSFAMSFGGAGFQYRSTNNAAGSRPKAPNPADLVQIHA